MVVDKKSIAECNREAWNEAGIYHQKARGNFLVEGFLAPDFTTFNRDCDHILRAKLDEIGLAGKTVAQLPCNNGRELLSLIRLGAREGVGFDISDIAIEEARKLADISKLNVKFERTDILDIDEKYNNLFDFIYISEGSLQWFPDLNQYFKVVAKLLKKNGNILIFEIHPIALLFETDFQPHNLSLNNILSYFEKGPHNYKNGLDYIGGKKYDAQPCYWFMHKLSDILNALTKNKIETLNINEYNNELANNSTIEQINTIPLSYTLIGKKK